MTPVALAVSVLVALGPVPLALAVVLLREREAVRESWSERALVFLLVWCLAQETLALVLLVTGALTRSGVAIGATVWLSVGLATFAVPCWRQHCTWHALPLPTVPLSATERLLGAAYAALGVYLCWTNVANPVNDYDSLAYHLPQMAEWVQHHGLAAFAQFQADQVGFYPYGWEAVCSLPLVAVGRDTLATLPNLVTLAILALATFRLASRIGARRVDAMLAALFLPCAPLLVEKVNALQVDLPLAAFFLAGCVAAWSWSVTRSRIDLVLLLACAGLAAGVKMSGLAYVPVLIALAVALGVAHREPGRPPAARAERHVSVMAAGIAVVACFVGAFWYVLNVSHCGNPLGEIQVQFGGFTVVAGDPGLGAFLRRTTLAHLFDPTNLHHWFILGRESFIRLGLPFLVSLPLIAAGFGSRRRDRWFLVAAAVAAALLYWTTPFTGDGGDHGFQVTPWTGQAFRYAFPCLGLLGALAGAGATRLGVRDRTIAVLLGVVATSVVGRILFDRSMIGSGIKPASSTGGLYFAAALVVAAVVVGAVAVLCYLSRAAWGRSAPERGDRPPRSIALWSAVLVSGALLAAVIAAAKVREQQRSRAYGTAYTYIAGRVPPGETVGYILSHRAYPLYGPDLARPVRWVPPQGNDLARWVAALRSEGVCTVAVGPVLTEWQSRQELGWLRDESGPFEPLYVPSLSQEMGVYHLRGCTVAPAGPPQRGQPQ
ncbi:MAG: hypothetical protein ACHQQS_10125 [Thermoanaerobaculales bacterium]